MPTFVSAITWVLNEYKDNMNYKDITKKIVDLKLKKIEGITPERTVNTEIQRELKKNKSAFKRSTNNTISLNPKIPSNEMDVTTLIDFRNSFIKNVTFHQSYSYENFMKSTKLNSDKPEKGFREFVNTAKNDQNNKFVLLIDEINRGNISKIFGELITLIGNDKRDANHQVQLSYSNELFSIPENLFIVGTMSTADRSLFQIEPALRRRFAFVELMPKPKLLTKEIEGVSLRNLLTVLNQRLIKEGLREKQIGHSYFIKITTKEELQFIFAHEIVPLLQDYFFDDYNKLENDILGSGFVDSKNMMIKLDWQTNSQLFLKILKDSF